MGNNGKIYNNKVMGPISLFILSSSSFLFLFHYYFICECIDVISLQVVERWCSDGGNENDKRKSVNKM